MLILFIPGPGLKVISVYLILIKSVQAKTKTEARGGWRANIIIKRDWSVQVTLSSLDTYKSHQRFRDQRSKLRNI